MAIKFDITGDNSSMINALNGVQTKVAQTAKDVEKSGMSVEQMFDRVKNAASIAIAGISLKSQADRVVETRGEFQQLEVAFQTMLGSSDKANNLMSQLVKTAASTPFDLQGVATGAKQLLAYGTAADDVNSTLIKLGNIAAGLSLNLNDLVWLYGTTMTQGRMFTQDLRQFMGRGIPMAEAIADVLGTTKDKVAGLVSAGKVTSDVVTKAIDKMATGTGKFAGLMEAQSRTITGQISNIEDAIDMMFNDIGKNSEGIINGALDTVSWLIDHYKEVGEVVLTAAAAFGEYKASLMLTAAAQKALQNQKDAIETTRQEGLGKILADNSSDVSDTAATTASTAATDADTAARQANKTAIDEQIASLQQSLAAKVAEAEANYNQATSEAADAALAVDAAKDKVEAAQEAYESILQSGDGEKIEAAETELNTAQANANSAAKDLQTKRAQVHTAVQAVETAKTKEQTVATQINTVNTQASTAATGLWAAATKAATTAFKSLKVAMMTNPFTAVIMGLTILAGLIPLFVSDTEEASGAMQKLRDTVRENQGKLISYKAILENCDKSTQMYKDTVSSFNQLAKQYNTTQISVTSTLREQEKAYNELTEAIRRQAAEKILADAGQDAVKKASDTEREAMDDLMDDAKNFSYTTNQVVGTTSAGIVMYATNTASSIRNITQDMWGAISAEVMSKSEEMADAFNKSPEAAEKFVAQEQATIENMLRSMGANNDDIAAFGGTIRNYLMDVGEGFADNYGELERTQQQLQGLQSATITLGDITTESIKTYSYEQLQQALQQVQNEIDNTNNKTLDPQVRTERLEYLKGLLIDINNLMPTQFTKGSLKDLQSRLKQAKDTRDSLDPQKNAKDWKKANDEVRQLNNAVKKRTSLSAENESKNARKSQATAKKAATAAKKTAKDRLQLAKQQQKYDELVKQQEVDNARALEDMEFDTRQAIIDKQKESTQKELDQAKLDFDKRKVEIQRGYEDLKKKKIEEAEKLFNANPKNKGKVFNPASVNTSYTAAETTNYNAQNAANEEEYNTKVKGINQKRVDAERASIQSYLKDYGDYQQKRMALTEEADDKIRKLNENTELTDTDREYQIKSIKEGLKKALADLDLEDLKKNINWDYVFGDLDNVDIETISAVKDQLQQIVDTCKDMTPDQIKTVTDAMQKLQEKMDLSNPIKSIREAKKEYAAAQKEFNAAKAERDKAQASGDTAGEKAATNKMTTASQKMTKAKNKEKKSFDAVTDVVNQYAQALTDAGDTIGGTTGEVLKLAASAITCGTSMVQGFKAVKEASSNLEKAVAILAIIQAAMQAIQLIMQVFGDSEDTTLTDYVDTMKVYIDLLNDSISDLNESMTDTKNTMLDTISYYEQLVELEKQSATAIKSQSQVWLNSGASKGFLGIGSKSSGGVKIRKQIEKDMSSSNAEVRKFYQEGFNNLNEYFKKVTGAYAKSASDFGRMDFIWNLSDDELVKLSEDTKAMALLGDTLSEAVANYAKKIKEAKDYQDSMMESLLSVSWDDFYDDFADVIKDMDSTSQDFANNFAEYMRNALVKNLVASQYKDRLEALYKQAGEWAKDGVLEQHIDELRKKYQEYAESAQKDVQTIDKITGYSNSDAYSQSGTTGGWTNVGQESIDELNGRFAALQMSGENISEGVANIITLLTSMSAFGTANNATFVEFRNLMITGNSYLEDIAKFSKNTYKDFGEKLDRLVTQTKNL